MTYTSSITASGLRLRESRIVAELLLGRPTRDEWRKAIVDRNVLQAHSSATARRVSSLLRARLEPLGEGGWTMLRDGDRDLATQTCFAGAVKNSRLLGDFLDITIREQLTLFAKQLEPRFWLDYIAGCRGRDPDMADWSDETVAKLRSAVFSMLAEAGYVANTRTLMLQNVFLDPSLVGYLRDRGETYVLRCMEVAS